MLVDIDRTVKLLITKIQWRQQYPANAKRQTKTDKGKA